LKIYKFLFLIDNWIANWFAWYYELSSSLRYVESIKSNSLLLIICNSQWDDGGLIIAKGVFIFSNSYDYKSSIAISV
jgi:hypothetical protein